MYKIIVKNKLFIIFFFLISCSEVENTDKQISLVNDKFNVLFIIVDDLNCDLGAYGNSIVNTPNIDRLASRGVLFNNAHTQYPWWSITKASLMTGMYTNQTKITNNNMNLRSSIPDVITIGQHILDNRDTNLFIGKIFHYDVPSYWNIRK